MPAQLAYLMSRFPHLPETFILREMNELERQGWPVALYLACMAITSGAPVPDSEGTPIARDRDVLDYLRSEVIARMR